MAHIQFGYIQDIQFGIQIHVSNYFIQLPVLAAIATVSRGADVNTQVGEHTYQKPLYLMWLGTACCSARTRCEKKSDDCSLAKKKKKKTQNAEGLSLLCTVYQPPTTGSFSSLGQGRCFV